MYLIWHVNVIYIPLYNEKQVMRFNNNFARKEEKSSFQTKVNELCNNKVGWKAHADQQTSYKQIRLRDGGTWKQGVIAGMKGGMRARMQGGDRE